MFEATERKRVVLLIPTLHHSEDDSVTASEHFRPSPLRAMPTQWSTLTDGHYIDGGEKDSGSGGAFSLLLTTLTD